MKQELNEKQAQIIIAKRNARKKWEKYKTLEQRRKVLKNAHEATRRKAVDKSVDPEK